jgi:undecaprenyl-diphosphatase
MTIIQSILLGIVQGITEFVPISSSGHLVLTPFVLGWHIPPEQAWVFNVLVQLGTLVAVIIYFWRDLLDIAAAFVEGLRRRQPFATPEYRMGWYIILATIPATLVGLILKDTVEAAFDSPRASAGFLLLTAALLLVAELAGQRQNKMVDLNWKDALIIGCFQILALFPGVSRSGATITGGMLRSLDRPAAARFSFLMSIPVMLGAGLLATIDLFQIPDLQALLPALSAGFLSSVVVGYLSIHWLLRFLTRRPLYIFSAYCTGIGILLLALTFLGP